VHTHKHISLQKPSRKAALYIWLFIFELNDTPAIKLIKASPYKAAVALTPGVLCTHVEARERRCGHGWAGAPGYTRDGCTTKPTQEITPCTGSKLKKPLRYASHWKAYTASQILPLSLAFSLALSGVGDDQYGALLLEQIRICNGLDPDEFSTALLKNERLFTAHAEAK